MAWIVKNSGGMKIERRDEPYLHDAMKRKLEADVLPRYATKQAALLPVLHAIQHEHNWIPAQALEEAGEFLGLSAAEVIDTASFYEEFFLEPKGRHLVAVCQSISCELCGQRDLSEKLKAKLGVISGETTDDGRITFVELECLGSCGTAPVALVNETLYENLTWEQLEKAIDELE